MLIGESTKTMLVWGVAGGLALVTLVGGALLTRKKPDALGTRIFIGVFAVLTLVAIGGNLVGFFDGKGVIRLRQAGGGPVVAERLRLYGSETYRFADGSTAELTGGVKTTVINDRAAPASIERVSYGFGINVDPTTPIAPYSVHRIDESVRFVGPTSRPPETMSGGGTEHWLSW